ncbi:MAG: energy-coupling factor transporter transmembrane component T family protein [Paracoccus sp. (in: a-proteobacteria)]
MISLTSPVRTWAHSWPAGLKLAVLCAATLALFFVMDITAMSAALVAAIGLYASAGRTFLRAGLRALRPLWPFVVLVGLWHLWTGEIAIGAILIMRMVTVVALANFVTMTTNLSDMMDVMHLLARPLAPIGLKPQVLTLTIALVIRMIPVLVLKSAQLTGAWRARSVKPAGWRIVLPLTVLALDDTDHIAEALRARGGVDSLKDD